MRDLLPPDDIEKKVITKKYGDCARWWYPEGEKTYEFVELSHARTMPYSKAFEITICKEADQELDLQLGLHQYVYNIGKTPFAIHWRSNGALQKEIINPDDTLYIKPFVAHNFRGNGKAMVLRIGGRMAGEAQREFSLIHKDDARRVIHEATMWFEAKGKQ